MSLTNVRRRFSSASKQLRSQGKSKRDDGQRMGLNSLGLFSRTSIPACGDAYQMPYALLCNNSFNVSIVLNSPLLDLKFKFHQKFLFFFDAMNSHENVSPLFGASTSCKFAIMT